MECCANPNPNPNIGTEAVLFVLAAALPTAKVLFLRSGIHSRNADSSSSFDGTCFAIKMAHRILDVRYV